MKTNIALCIFITLLGIYLIRSGNKTSYLNPTPGDYAIKLERVDNTIKETPPVLMLNSFESDKDAGNWLIKTRERKLISLRRSCEYASQGNCSMRIDWHTDEWAELKFVHFPQEWENYTRLCFDIYNPMASNEDFLLRIGDRFDITGEYAYEKKFTLRASARPGWSTCTISLADAAREFNIQSQRKVIHFRLFREHATVYMDNLRLER